MKWEDISRRLPGRSAISCRLHYQNFLERRPEWDEEKKNKLARLYDRFKKDMWDPVAKELEMPWRAVEAMHWQLGGEGIAQRAGVPFFSMASSSSIPVPIPAPPTVGPQVMVPSTTMHPATPTYTAVSPRSIAPALHLQVGAQYRGYSPPPVNANSPYHPSRLAAEHHLSYPPYQAVHQAYSDIDAPRVRRSFSSSGARRRSTLSPPRRTGSLNTLERNYGSEAIPPVPPIPAQYTNSERLPPMRYFAEPQSQSHRGLSSEPAPDEPPRLAPAPPQELPPPPPRPDPGTRMPADQTQRRSPNSSEMHVQDEARVAISSGGAAAGGDQSLRGDRNQEDHNNNGEIK